MKIPTADKIRNRVQKCLTFAAHSCCERVKAQCQYNQLNQSQVCPQITFLQFKLISIIQELSLFNVSSPTSSVFSWSLGCLEEVWTPWEPGLEAGMSWADWGWSWLRMRDWCDWVVTWETGLEASLVLVLVPDLSNLSCVRMAWNCEHWLMRRTWLWSWEQPSSQPLMLARKLSSCPCCPREQSCKIRMLLESW